MLPVIIWFLILECCLTASVTSEECVRTDTRREFQVTCDSRQVSRSYCSPGQRVNDSCLEDPCVYCPEGQYQDMYTNCETCLNCTTKEDCCNGQVLTSDCKTNKNAECGCPACPEAMTPTCPTCPTVCNITNQTEAPDGTLTTLSSAADPDEVTTSSMTSSDANIVTKCPPLGTEDPKRCEGSTVKEGWKTGCIICMVIIAVLLIPSFVGVKPLCEKFRRQRQRQNGDRSNAEPSQEDVVDSDNAQGNPLQSENDMLLKSCEERRDKAESTKKNCELRDKIAELRVEIANLEERLRQQSKPLGNKNQETSDTVQPSTSGRDPSRESGMKMSAESQKVHQSATSTNSGGPSSAYMKPDEVVSDKFLQKLSGSVLADEWKPLGRHLSVKDAELDRCKTDINQDHKETVYQMFKKWKKKKGKDATYQHLGNALVENGQKDLYDEHFKFDETS